MISWHDLYNVLAAMVPLYVAMILAYGSVRWWKIFTPDQCSGINRFVAVFAVPLLSFHFISTNNPYEFNLRFIAADTLQKLIMLAALTVWSNLPFRRKNSKSPSLGWIITLFSLSTLPNTLVMGIPLLIAMYGPYSGSLMVQVVVLQCIIWYTLLLFLFEYRGAKILISEQFPETGASIVSFKVDSDVVSLDGGEFLETDAEVGDDGKIHVRVRKSNVSRRSVSGGTGMGMMTPRPSNLTGAEIYSLSSSRNPTPRGSNFNNSDFYSMMGYGVGGGFGNSNMNVRNSNFGAADLYSLQSSRGPTPRPSNYEETQQQQQQGGGSGWGSNSNNNPYPSPNPEFVGLGGVEAGKSNTGGRRRSSSGSVTREGESAGGERKMNHHHDAKELHMFVWSSSASPVSEVGGLHVFGGTHNHPQNHVQQDYLNSNSMMISGGRRSGSGADDGAKEIRMLVSSDAPQNRETPKMGNHNQGGGEVYGGDQFSFGGGKVGGSLEYEKEKEKAVADDDDDGLHIGLSKLGSSSTVELHPDIGVGGEGGATEESSGPKQMPPASVMTRLILIMVWRKLIRNPNTYSSLIGVIWSLIAFRWNVEMPKIIKGSISILSDAGLGMAMFSLGLFMALQPKIIACGNSVAAYSMLVRFVTGPAVMAIASIIIGLRGDLLRIAIIQAALPQGIVPFVFSKEYNNHPAILSTAVIFGMLIALPIDLLYYILLRL